MKIFKIIILSLLVSIPIYSQREYKNEIFKQGLDNIDEFIEFLSYPNDANYESDIYKLMDWTEKKFISLDFEINRLDTETIPLLLASKHIDDNYKTVLIYMHLDGQPVDLSKWNQENPFIPVYKLKENEEFIDYDSKTIYLNRIFKWFKKDFGDLKKYICKYLEEYQFHEIKNFKIKFFKYNWNKNNSKK